MKKYYKLISVVLCLLSAASLWAANAKYESELYTLNVSYNEKLVPGDAVFARLKISTPKKKGKLEADKKASLVLIKDKKTIETAPFYQISFTKKTNTIEMLCGIPLSSWLTDGNFDLQVIFSSTEEENLEFSLPVYFENREFDSETIELDAQNTAIKTDASPERTAQIEKLNDILFTTMTTDVFALKPFQSPTTSTRYTAHFGDRRVYAYSNGKSSTSLHYGNDYGVPTGTEVKACAEGKVVMAENRISTGWSVVIEHLPGLYSLYYHMSELSVKEGDMVKCGDLIGKSGATGLATGPHLHWEMRLNGSAVRPEFFLNNFTFCEE